MSDIPIGSPPAPPGRHAAPQGWYPDPVDPARERWWDGWTWSRNTREAEITQPPPTPGTWPAQQFPPGQLPPGQVPHGHRSHQAPPRPPAGPQTEDGVPLAGWGWRLLAGVIDLIAVTILGTLASLPILLRGLPVFTDYFNRVMAAAERGEPQPPMLRPEEILPQSDQMLVTLISVSVAVAYFALFWRVASATPGQLICSLRVVPFGRGRNTEKLGWGTAIIRALIWAVPLTASSLLVVFAALNALFPLWNASRQAIHDLAAKTQVVKIK